MRKKERKLTLEESQWRKRCRERQVDNEEGRHRDSEKGDKTDKRGGYQWRKGVKKSYLVLYRLANIR